jgi:tRNA dimethylallyltransferase
LRLRRVWEVYNFTGITFSQWKKKQNKNFLNKFNNQVYLFTPDRESIYNLVNSRFESMVKLGAIEEVEKLILLNLDLSLPIMRAHGVPEISNYLSKKISLEDCIQRGQQVTRNYVKRQLSWWRSSKIDIHQNFQEFPNKIDENMIKI